MDTYDKARRKQTREEKLLQVLVYWNEDKEEKLQY